jgi:nicotinic acid mononucleotide adenylyltransferase
MLEYSLFEQRKLQVNSSEIRELLRAGRSIRYLVTDGVWQYIHDHGLYTGNAD